MARSPGMGWRCAAVVVISLSVMTCRRPDRTASNALAASLIFDSPSSDAREALTSSVAFTITADNFARWQEASDNLDQLPPSAIRSTGGSRGTAIDRAVSRLQSSPSARRAIESAGLSVRDFVLETIVLAQATEAAQTGKTTSPTPILADNYEFVRQYRSGGLRVEADEETSTQLTPPIEETGNADPTSETPAPPTPPMPPDPPQEPFDMRVEMREQMAAEMTRQAEVTMQLEAEQAERAAQMQSERELRRLQERVRREMNALMQRYRSRAGRFREQR